MKQTTFPRLKQHPVMTAVAVFILSAFILGAIPPVHHGLSGVLHNPKHMAALENNPQIHYENGALEYAKYVADILPACIAQVESAQGAFAQPVIIGVYKTKDAFAAAGGVGNANAAAVDFIHFIGGSVKAFNPDSLLNPSNSRGLKLGL